MNLLVWAVAVFGVLMSIGNARYGRTEATLDNLLAAIGIVGSAIVYALNTLIDQRALARKD